MNILKEHMSSYATFDDLAGAVVEHDEWDGAKNVRSMSARLSTVNRGKDDKFLRKNWKIFEDLLDTGWPIHAEVCLDQKAGFEVTIRVPLDLIEPLREAVRDESKKVGFTVEIPQLVEKFLRDGLEAFLKAKSSEPKE